MTSHVANERFIIFTVGLIIFIELLDSTVLQTSLPQIAYSLQVNPLTLKVALTIYLLAVGTFIPASGWFAERFGIKRILLISVTGFIVSSVLCGLSMNLTALTLSRALQGIFGAFMTPVARLFIVHLFKSRLGEVMVRVIIIALLAPLVGPLLGGAITTYLNWRFIFFINIPTGLFILWVIAYRFPSWRGNQKPPFDFQGFILLSIALLALLFSIDVLTLAYVSRWWKMLCIAGCFLLFIGYYMHANALILKESEDKLPIIDIRIFKDYTYRYFTFLLVIYQIFVLNTAFVTTLYVQTRLHYTALNSGLFITPMIVGVMFSRVLLHYLRRRISLYKQISFLYWFTIVNRLLFSLLLLHFNLPLYIVLLLISGMCNGYMISIIQQNIYHQLKQQQITPGSVINSAIKQLSQSFTFATVAAILMLSTDQSQLEWNTALPKFSYAIVMWVSAISLLISGFLLKKLKKQALYSA